MPSTMNPQQCFLSDHYVREQDKFAGEILAIRSLVDSFPSERHDEAAGLFTPKRFFYGFDDLLNVPAESLPASTYPGAWLYAPVKTYPYNPDKRDGRDRSLHDGASFSELSELLLWLDEPSGDSSEISSAAHPFGILLTAKSGAGKSVAQFKAMFDCHHARGEQQPRLAGRQWCRLRSPKGLGETFTLIDMLPFAEDLGSNSAQQAQRRRAINRWLEAGPPLLIFCDLNAIDREHVEQVANALRDFQNDPLRQRQGHRCVVAYRSTQRSDTAFTTLLGSDAFRDFEMEQLPVRLADEYVSNLRIIRQAIAGEEFEVDLQQTTRISEFANQLLMADGSSIISTPLLMHFASILDDAQLDRCQSLSDFYSAVVKKLLENNHKNYSNRMSGVFADEAEYKTRVQLAMSRVALAIVTLGADETRLTDFDQLLRTPASWLREKSPPGRYDPPELPHYLSGSLLPKDAKEATKLRIAIKEYSLLRGEGSQLAFLHDSFLYYFAAQALWQPESEDVDWADDAWFDKVAAILASEPLRWRQPLQFLAGRLEDSEQCLRLVERLIPADPKPGLTELVQVLCREQANESSTEASKLLSAIHAATIRYGSWCRDNSARLFPQVYHELRWRWGTDQESFLKFVETRLESRRSQPEPIRCTLGGWVTDSNPSLTLTGGVNCLSILNDKLVIIGCGDGYVRSWNPSTGEQRDLVKHEKVVTSLEVLEGGRVVSGSEDGAVKLWSAEQRVAGATDPEQVPTIVQHEGVVTSLVVLEGGRVVSGSTDGTVKLWYAEQWEAGALAPGQVPTIIKHDKGVTSLAVLEGGRVVSGSEDGAVKLWSAEHWEAEAIDLGAVPTIVQHKDGVTSLAVLEGGRVVSGGGDGLVKLWSAQQWEAGAIDPKKVPTIVKHHDMVDSLAVLEGGRVVSASWRGVVKLWSAEEWEAGATDPEEVPTIIEHRAFFSSLAVLEGDQVVSASRDGVVKLWAADQWAAGVIDPEQVPTIVQYGGWLNSLAVLEGGRVVSGSDDGLVKLWSADQCEAGTTDPEQIATIFKHKNGVTSLVVLEGGRVVSGSWDRAVKLWSLEHFEAVATEPEQVPAIVQHELWVSALAVLEGGRVVSGGGDGLVKLWSAEQWEAGALAPGQVPTIIKHDKGVTSLAVLEGGRVVSGSEDGVVKLWSAEAWEAGATDPEQVPTIIKHDKRVNSLAALEGGRVVSGSEDGAVKLWSAEQWEAGVTELDQVPTIVQHERAAWGGIGVNVLAVLKGGRVVSGGDEGAVKLWSAEHWEAEAIDLGAVPTIVQHKDGVTSLAVLEGGRVVSGGGDGLVKLWSIEQREAGAIDTEQVATIVQHGGAVTALVVLEGGRILSAGADNMLRLAELTSKSVICEHAFTARPSHLAYDQSNSMIWIGFHDGHVECWQVDR
ncbi:NACHT and WD40 repeat domain-containing protein [Adhaeretor mobilis]|uniref:WD domain, G-beta repeat n=1 Tax=Adhaeretor mobilis TaxID=1930276 RepID=A0A517MQQ8_9BACT|nr:WD40 repeat domain-containing protein [Adhaeretor mobilis]QDS97215.1 WD domain, G-beta repeat [Adhaeretor mobilis]